MNPSSSPDEYVHGALFSRVDAVHPLDFYKGADVVGDPLLLLVTPMQVGATRRFRALSVQSRHREDGKWVLLLKLTDLNFVRPFSMLCSDLIESSRQVTGPEHGGEVVWARFAVWQRFFERSSTDLLGEDQLRGLLGELYFLEAHVIPDYGLEQAIMGWLGPTGADQDFRLPARYFEIKTIHPGATTVTVSSAEQLDCPPGIELVLVIIELESAPPDSTLSAFTPIAIIDKIKQLLYRHADLLDLFEARLADVGFVPLNEYQNAGYIARIDRMYRVTDGFPAIRRSQLPQAIGTVRWDLVLSALLPHEIRMN